MTKSNIRLNQGNDLISDNKFYLVVISLLLIFISSCAKPAKLPDISAIDANEYLDLLKDEQNVIKSVKGLALVRLSSRQNKVSYRQATIAQSPNLMRLEAYSVLGRTEAVIISDGQRVGLKFAGRAWVYYDIDHFDISLFYRFIPANIDINQLTSFLLGKIPDEIFEEEFVLSADEKNGFLIFTSASGDNVFYVNYDFNKIVKAEISLKNREKLMIKYDDFINIRSGVYFPTKLEMEYMNHSIYVKYDDDIDINDEIDQDNYSLN